MSIFDRFRRNRTGLFVPQAPSNRLPRPGAVAGYQLQEDPDGQIIRGLVYEPDHVRRMPRRQRHRWWEEHGLVPAIGGGAGYGNTFLQMLEPFQVADSTTLSTSTTETAISSDTFMQLPPNFFANPGKQIWLRYMGKVSNIVTSPGTIQFRLRYNAVAGTLLTNSGAVNFKTTASTDNLWYVDMMVMAIATTPATTGLTLLSYGELFMPSSAMAVADIQNASMPPAGTSLANVASLDGTTGKAMTLTAQFSVSNAGNAITVRDAFIVAMN